MGFLLKQISNILVLTYNVWLECSNNSFSQINHIYIKSLINVIIELYELHMYQILDILN